MAYYSGTANDMAAVRTALVTACTAEGWTWNAAEEVLHKGTMFIRIWLDSGFMKLLGRTGLTTGGAPEAVQMGPLSGSYSAPLPALDWPVGYELFVFSNEVYCLINYNVDVYQWCAFGQSEVQDINGTGLWLGASASAQRSSYAYGIYIQPDGGANSMGYMCPALFWRIGGMAASESWVHTQFDNQEWLWGAKNSDYPVGIRSIVPLLTLLPNTWNSEAILLPIRAFRHRLENRISLIAELQHARYTRVDHYTPGQVITIGNERWKVYPWYRKNASERDGGSHKNHTGTLGWAIRYEGP